MTSLHTSLVWTSSAAKGPHKLVLLALADHAGRNGEAQLSLRDMASLCGLSKTRIEEIITGLIDLGELRVRSGGGGRGNPTTYWITLRAKAIERPEVAEPKQTPDKTPPVVTTEIWAPPRETWVADPEPVQSVRVATPEVAGVSVKSKPFTAAGIEKQPDQPFYWNRTEHRADLAALLSRSSMTIEDACAHLTKVGPAKDVIGYDPRRLTDLEQLMKRKAI